MDESPEELEKIRREAERIDPYKYRKRSRAMAAVGVGALGAGLIWGVMQLINSARNPCERVRNYLCARDPRSIECSGYEDIFKDSVIDKNAELRGSLRAQCVTKIQRMQEDDGIRVP